jgi:HD superfamily phosphodiesterase
LNSFAKQIDEAVIEYKRITNECSKCSQLNECGGGCLAEIISAGNMIEPQLFCESIPYPETEIYGISFRPTAMSLDENQKDLTELEENKIKEYVFNNIKKRQHDLSHSYDHVVAVVNNARYIAKKEGANLRIVTAAAYFHDFSPRRKLIYECHTKSSANAAVNFLSSIGFNDLDLEEIFKCIGASSYGAAEMGVQHHSLEARIVRDADLLDAIGARGIARVFASAHNCETLGDVEWDIDNPPKKTVSLVGPDPSPIYHFFQSCYG